MGITVHGRSIDNACLPSSDRALSIDKPGPIAMRTPKSPFFAIVVFQETFKGEKD